jgi:hypothetical protein
MSVRTMADRGDAKSLVGAFSESVERVFGSAAVKKVDVTHCLMRARDMATAHIDCMLTLARFKTENNCQTAAEAARRLAPYFEENGFRSFNFQYLSKLVSAGMFLQENK